MVGSLMPVAPANVQVKSSKSAVLLTLMFVLPSCTLTFVTKFCFKKNSSLLCQYKCFSREGCCNQLHTLWSVPTAESGPTVASLVFQSFPFLVDVIDKPVVFHSLEMLHPFVHVN